MTKTFYATHDAEDGRIADSAHIVKFATKAEAEEYLRQPFSASEFTVEIGSGRFSDCWFKSYSGAPRVGDSSIAPFSRSQVRVRAPGEHPGGRAWWIEPNVDVLVATAIPIEEAE